MSELLDAAIEEIGRVLIGNKDRNTEEVYLKNAIRHIREYGSQPQLNENQQIVLEWLKGSYVQGYGATVIITIHLLQKLNDIDVLGDEPVTKAYRALNTEEEIDVIKVFADWALEQEEE